MANNKKENKIEKFTKEAIGKTLNQFNKEIGIADLVEVNKNQDRMLNGILSQVNDESTEKTEKSNIITLDNSTDGIVELKEIQGDTNVNVSKIEEDMPITNDIGDKEGNIFSLNEVTQGAINIGEIQGNTLVNCNKDDKKELVLMKDLSAQGDNNITITEGVDGGLVDVALEGNTLVNVSKTKDSTAVTKAYTVENSGNHVALQGDIDGSCRPVVTGKTLVNLWNNGDLVSNYVWAKNIKSPLLKPNTIYTIKCDYTRTNEEVASSQGSIMLRSTNNVYMINCEEKTISTFTTPSDYNDSYDILYYGSTSGVTTYSNIMLLEGDYTDKPIPDYFEGLQSTFEDNLVTQEMVDSGEEVAGNLGKYKVEYKVTGKNKFDINKLIKACSNKSTINITTNSNNSFTIQSTSPYVSNILVDFGLDMSKQYSIKYDNSNNAFVITQVKNGFNFYINPKYNGTIVNLQIEEGNTATAYEPYKESTKTLYLNSPLLEGDTIEEKNDGIYHVHRYTKVVLDGVDNSGMRKERNAEFNDDNTMLKVPYFREDIKEIAPSTKYDNSFCDKLCWKPDIPNKADDTPCYGRGNLYWRLMISIPVTTNSDEAINTYLQSNPLTFVLPLKTPQYELIEQSNLAIPSYENGHLDFNTAVPVEQVDFLPFSEELTYLYANTQYTIQFVSDKAMTANITLGGTSLLAQNIVAGLNRISITTPETLVDNKLIMDGVGANISEAVVTDTDRKFEYFEGMKSVGECEDLEVMSKNENLFDEKNCVVTFENTWHYVDIKNLPTVVFNGKGYARLQHNYSKLEFYTTNKLPTGNVYDEWQLKGVMDVPYNVEGNIRFNVNNNLKHKYLVILQVSTNFNNYAFREFSVTTEVPTIYTEPKSNTQQLTHEPLRAVGDVKDRYVLIDGKWHIERNVGKYTYTGKEPWSPVDDDRTTDTARTFLALNTPLNAKADGNLTTFKSNKLPNKMHTSSDLGIWIDIHTFITLPRNEVNTIAELRLWLQSNPITGLYQLKTPQYEEIDYNPLEVYSGITHITTNSTIPTNITIKNYGYNCILKPSTTYTVSSNLGINTVTTPAELTENCLRFYDEDTNDVNIMKDVLVLEGDWTSKANLIPSNFSGIESCFEQEYDAEKGKYKVTAKVVGKNLFDINNITNGRSDGKFIAKEFNINGSSVTLTGGMAVLKFESKKNTDYYLSCTFKSNQNNDIPRIYIYDKNLNQIYFTNSSNVKFNSNDNDILYIGLYIAMLDGYRGSYSNIQLEQGDTATTYEPYQESNITFYINEPLRGIGDVKDKICIKDDKVVVQRNCGSYIINDGSNFKIDNHNNISRNRVNRFIFNGVLLPNAKDLGSTGCSNICNILPVVSSLDTELVDSECISIRGSSNIWGVMICVKQPSVDSFKQWIQQNPITIVYELAEPVYEEVEYSSNRLILDTFNNESFNNSTLLLNTNISPKISLKPLYEELTYVKPNTKYYIQFNAVGSGEVVISLGGTELTTEIVEGYNCIPITTPSESTNLMTISGQGITINEVIVSEVVCGGYYKGLQSCFEEHMENGKYRILLRGIALDGSKVNGIKLYINEPLRGIGDVKDRLCIKNGKLMVERNIAERIVDDTTPINMSITNDEFTRFTVYHEGVRYPDHELIKCSGFPTQGDKLNAETILLNTDNIVFAIANARLKSIDVEGFKEWIKEHPQKVQFKVSTTYEEVTNEYGLPIVFEGYENGIVYIDSAVTPTTHIKYTSNNQLAITLSEAEEQNIATQEDINMNVITYMMDIDMMLTDMEMSNDISVMAVRRDSSNENMLDRMSDEDKKVYRDNTVVMLEKMITAKVLDKEDIEGRIDMYYNKNRISKEQYKYLKSLL